MSHQPQARSTSLRQLREQVFQSWIARLREDVPFTRDVPDPILISTLPLFYEHLVELSCAGRSKFNQSTLASEHGGERARLTNYDVESVAYEMQLLRQTILKVWSARGIRLSANKQMKFSHAVDEALLDALAGFVMVETFMREQYICALAKDLRTPLGTASMAVQMILHTDVSERVVRLAASASRQHETMDRMIGALTNALVVSDPDGAAADLAEMDFRELVQDAAIRLRERTGRVVQCSLADVLGFWNREAMKQAVENLLDNAEGSSNPGSAIDVALTTYRDRLILTVTHRGVPIPPDEQESIFQLFRRSVDTKHGAKAWRTGLPFVRTVAEQHAGSVAVESNDAQTRMILDVPIDPRAMIAVRPQRPRLDN